jgi:hypothetical protein
VPQLDYAVLADYVRPEGGLAHGLGLGIDTIYAPDVPTGQNVGLLARLTFSRQECGRQHRLEVIFQDQDGERLAEINATTQPEWVEDQPVGWPMGVLLVLNFGVPLPAYGVYSFEMLLNDSLVKSIPLRVVPQRGS